MSSTLWNLPDAPRRPEAPPDHVDRFATAAYATAIQRVTHRLGPMEELATTERAAAGAIHERLMQMPPGLREERLRSWRHAHTYALAERLLDAGLEAAQATDREPSAGDMTGLARSGVDLARMALDVASVLDPARYGRGLLADLQARCWACLGSAWSVSSPRRSAEAFRLARSHLHRGSGDPVEAIRVLGLQADDPGEAAVGEEEPAFRGAGRRELRGRRARRRRFRWPRVRIKTMFGPRDRFSSGSAASTEGSGRTMVELHSPAGEAELLLLRSVLDGAGLHYFVKGDLFGSLAVGPQIDHYNRKTIYVHPEDHEEARALVAEFLSKTSEPRRAAARDLRLGDVLRMVLEVLVFGWFMPGRRRRTPRPPELRLIQGGTNGSPEGETAEKPTETPAGERSPGP
ncbi:MAG: hypothetical protein ACLF0P_02160 [Thermoanaerobaculia bacterium]